MEYLFSLGLTTEGVLKRFSSNKLFERKLLPVVFSYLFACDKRCQCRRIIQHITGENLDFILRVKKKVNKGFVSHYRTLSHVRCTQIDNCIITVTSNGNILCNTDHIGQFIDILPGSFFQEIEFFMNPIDKNLPFSAVIEYDELHFINDITLSTMVFNINGVPHVFGENGITRKEEYEKYELVKIPEKKLDLIRQYPTPEITRDDFSSAHNEWLIERIMFCNKLDACNMTYLYAKKKPLNNTNELSQDTNEEMTLITFLS